MLRSRRLTIAALLLAAPLSACVYRIDVQQGNYLEQDTLDQVEVGMTRSQVRFLLGTPLVDDPFHDDRWDYVYYFRKGNNSKVTRQWFRVYFDGDRVARTERGEPGPDPSGAASS